MVTGLGLSLVIAITGFVVLAIWWRTAVRVAADTARLSDGAVLIIEAGKVVEVSAHAKALLGQVLGREARDVLSEFLGSGSDAALAAMAALERNGDAIHLITTDATGRPLELAGEAQGSQLRLILRDAGLLEAELNRALEKNTERHQALSQREAEIESLAGLLADAPLAAWNRTPEGHVTWSAGRIPTNLGAVAAATVAAAAAKRTGSSLEPPKRPESGATPHPAERFRLEIA
ncbi:MAG: hypothetical protein E4H18_05610, partial [Hyphomicrobiales bacterium]